MNRNRRAINPPRPPRGAALLLPYARLPLQVRAFFPVRGAVMSAADGFLFPAAGARPCKNLCSPLPC